MELNQLRYFIAVADLLSFTEAADRLHVSQPALSHQVKRLENELGARLFDRTSRKVSLTVDGRTFLPLARSVLLKVDEAARVMDERLGVETGQVTFGVIPSIGAYVVPHILASFRRNYPGIEVLLVEAGALTLERKLLDGEVDFAIVTEPAAPEALDVTPLMTEELLLVVPLHHPLAERESVALRELTEESFVLLGGSFTLGTLVVDLCRRAGFEPKVAYQAGSLETVKSFVRRSRTVHRSTDSCHHVGAGERALCHRRLAGADGPRAHDDAIDVRDGGPSNTSGAPATSAASVAFVAELE
jgi:DNA-binding transcriptional LysR family regulator